MSLTDADREALRFAFVHYHPDYDEGSRAYEVVERILARHVAAAKAEALREVGRRIADLRKRNPMNGDGSNYTLGLLLASLQSASADEGDRERTAERDAAEAAMYDRLDRENRERADRIGGRRVIRIIQTCDGCGATRTLTDLTADRHGCWREVGIGRHLCKACIDVALEGR